MFRAAAVGVLALTTGMISLASAQHQWGASAPSASTSAPPRVEAAVDPRRTAPRERSAASDSVITESHIARLRATLRLTSAQQAHWLPVEVALSELARQQARGEAAGFSQKFTDRGASLNATMTQLRRIKSIALPLIKSLDENQKRDAISFARNMGFQQLVAAF